MKSLLGMTLLGLALAPFSFAITGGNAVVSRTFTDMSTSNFAVVDLNNPINGAGQITTWQVYAANTNPVALLLYHPTGGSYTLLGQSTQQTPAVGVNSFTLSSPITVQAGDVVGLFFPSNGSVAFDMTGLLSLGNLTGSALFTASGTGIGTFTDSSQRTYSVTVTGNGIAATPVPPSVTLTLVGIAMLAFFAGSRKFARV